MLINHRNWRLYFFELRVLLDGVEQQEVIEADDVAGYIVRYKRDPFGKSVVDRTAGRMARERIEGKVELIGERRTGTPETRISAAEEKRARRRAHNIRISALQELRDGTT